MIAARAAVAAWKQDRFWEYIDQVFEEQGRGIRGDETYVEIARRVGLDVDRFEADRQGSEVGQYLQRDLAEAKRLMVTRTPTIYINGILLEKEATPANVEEAVRKIRGY
jgi:predicted DsbA family dithiol-disulfide isomerase